MAKRTYSLLGTANGQSLPDALRGVVGNEVGTMGGGHIADSLGICV